MVVMRQLLLAMLVVAAVGTSADVASLPSGCEERFFTQRLDHFRWQKGSQPTFPQRYIVCDHANWTASAVKGPIFFYCGNEGPLEGYVGATGLMFENAEAFGALILFAEHRYYGKTQPFGPDSWRVDPSYLTAEQAMADYTTLLWDLTRQWGAETSPIVAFGGSYGGMLAAWMRRKYPHIITGAVAASAPVGQFPCIPGFNPASFWDVVTRDATSEAGAAPDCAANVKEAFRQLFAAATTPESRALLQKRFRLCDALQSAEQVTDLAYWVQGAFDAFAMGNYHFASSYMTGHKAPLPAFPMRVACEIMSRVAPSTWPAATRAGGTRALADLDTDLLERLRDAAGLLYNVTGDQACFKLDLSGPAAGSSGPWDYQVCTEFLGQELPYFPASNDSMFWDQGPFDWESVEQHCQQAWGVTPTKCWSAIEHGGLDWRSTSNIAFSNGGYDPWSVFGVLANVSDTVVAVHIADGAHHSDLMYSRPDDSSHLTAARVTIMQHVRTWVQQHSSSVSAASITTSELKSLRMTTT